MRCLLFVSFAVKVYKKPPRLRIFLDKNLIDERNLSNDTTNYSDLKYKQDILSPQMKKYEEISGSMQVYEVETSSEEPSLELEIENNDNNFTNGFMTKFTAVTLLYLNLVPLSSLSEKKIKKLEKYKFSRANFCRYVNDPCKIKNWYRKRPYLLRNLVWKNGPTKFIKQDSTKLINACGWTVGESGSFVCELKKKFGMYVAKNIKNFVGYYNFMYSEHKKLYDKYYSNENQRNNN